MIPITLYLRLSTGNGYYLSTTKPTLDMKHNADDAELEEPLPYFRSDGGLYPAMPDFYADPAAAVEAGREAGYEVMIVSEVAV